MSVPAPLRKKSKLDVQVKAEQLVVHTVHITSNPNVFDPKYKSVIDRVTDCAIGIGQDLWEANGIRVTTAEDYARRRSLQTRAIGRLDALMYLMTVCRKTFGLRTKKYEYWVKLARETKACARAWRDSDARRYGRLASGG